MECWVSEVKYMQQHELTDTIISEQAYGRADTRDLKISETHDKLSEHDPSTFTSRYMTDDTSRHISMTHTIT